MWAQKGMIFQIFLEDILKKMFLNYVGNQLIFMIIGKFISPTYCSIGI